MKKKILENPENSVWKNISSLKYMKHRYFYWPRSAHAEDRPYQLPVNRNQSQNK